MGGTLTVNASVGGEVVYAEELAAAPSDYHGNILRSNRWLINLPASAATDAAAELIVEFAVKKPYIPPPPPPPPAPRPLPACASALCLELSSTSDCNPERAVCEDVGLDWPWVGSLDWLHYNPKPVGKAHTGGSGETLISCTVKGKPSKCPAAGTDTYTNNPTTFSWSQGGSPRTGWRDGNGLLFYGGDEAQFEHAIKIPASEGDIVVRAYVGTRTTAGYKPLATLFTGMVNTTVDIPSPESHTRILGVFGEHPLYH